MCNKSSMAVLIIGILMSGPGFADDLAQAYLTPAAQAFLADLERSAHSPPQEYFQPIRYTDNFVRPFPDVEFSDSGFLNRISKLRRVSFLTLAEFDQSQLIFGVNNKGLLGFHFNAYRNGGKERQLEMLRMPYLVDNENESK
jgi:hypothetical protein